MHLFALFIAAVFSSQFVEPNAASAITTSLTGVTAYARLMGLPAFTVTVANYDDEDMTFVLADAATNPTATAPLTGVHDDAGLFNFAIGQKAKALVGAATLFIIATPDGEDPLTVTVPVAADNQWTATPTGGFTDTQLTSTPAIVFAAVGGETWPATDLEVYFTWTRAGGSEAETAKFEVAYDTTGSTYTMAAEEDLSALGILTSDFASAVVLKAHLLLTENDEHPLTADITISKVTADWAFTGKTGITEVELAQPYSVAVLPESGILGSWVAATEIAAIFTLKKTKPTALTGQVTAEIVMSGGGANTGETFAITAANLYELAVTADTKEIYVWAALTTAATHQSNTLTVHPKPISFPFTKETPNPPTGTFTITHDPVEVDDLADMPAIVFAASDVSGWADLMRAKFVNGDNSVVLEVKKTGSASGANAFVWSTDEHEDLSDLAMLTAGDVNVFLSPKGTRNYIATSVPLTVTGGATVITPDPTEFVATAPLVTAKIKLSPSDATVLTITHYVKLTYPAPANADVEVTLIKEGNDFFIPAGESLATLGTIASYPAVISCQLYDDADAPVGLPFVLTVQEAAFTVSPLTIDLAATTLPNIVVTQKSTDAAAWTDNVFFHLAKAPSDNPKTIALTEEPEYALASTKHTWTVAEFDATKITGIKKEDKIYLYVATGATTAGTGTIVPACVGVITVEDSTVAETTFTLASTQMNWATPLKTTKTKISPVPATGHNWPEAANSMKVKFALPASASNTDPDPVELVVLIEGETVGAKEYFIPAEGVLTTLLPTEITADATLEVYVSLDAGDTYLKHKVDVTVKKPGGDDAAMGVSPLFSLLAALVFLFVKLF